MTDDEHAYQLAKDVRKALLAEGVKDGPGFWDEAMRRIKAGWRP